MTSRFTVLLVLIPGPTRVDIWLGRYISGSPLDHGDVRGPVADVRQDCHGGGAGANHGNSLANQLLVVLVLSTRMVLQ